jgi:hypothetical protein
MSVCCVFTPRPRPLGRWEREMHEFLNRIGCVGFVVVLVFPFGQQAFPLMTHLVGGDLQFVAIEAGVSAALGSRLYSLLFG